VPKASLHVTNRFGSATARRALPDYAGNTVESVTSLSMVCSRTLSTVAPIFRSIAVDYPDLLALFEWAACHHFEQNAFLGSRILEYLDADRVGFPESACSLNLSSIFGIFIARSTPQ